MQPSQVPSVNHKNNPMNQITQTQISQIRNHFQSIHSHETMQNSLQNSKYKGNKKSHPLSNLSIHHGFRVKQPDQFLNQRVKDTKQQLTVKMGGIEDECLKFGGIQYIKDQMNKQKISKQELNQFYRNRIKSIHGSLSLPRIETKGFKFVQSDIQRKSGISKGKKSIKNYNKWYVDPSKRFVQRPTIVNADMKNVTQYINKLFRSHNKNVSIKQEYAPIVVKESENFLGRKPIVSIYAQIKRR